MVRRSTFLFIRIVSFISSIFPFSLYVYLEYRNDTYEFWGNPLITPKNGVNILMFLQIASIIYIIYFFKFSGIKRNSGNKKIIVFNSLKREKDTTTNYILANVLPVATIDMDNENKSLFVIILLLFLAFLHVKNDLFYINPLFELIGVKVYECDCKIYDTNMFYEGEFDGRVISNIELFNDKNIKYKANKTPNEVLFIEDCL